MGDGERDGIFERYTPKAEYLRRICSELVGQVVDGEPGTDPVMLKGLDIYKKNCRMVAGLEKIPPKKQKKIEQFMADEKLDKDKAFVTAELLDATVATLKYIDNEGDRWKLGANANREFIDFFLKIQRKFDLSEEDLGGIFDSIFSQENMRQEFRDIKEMHFPGGVWAVVRSVFTLQEKVKKEGWGEGVFRVPTVDEDVDYGIDLIWTPKTGGKDKIFQVKGSLQQQSVSVNKIGEVVLTDEEKRKGQEGVLNRMVRYSQDNGIEAYWVRAPTRW